MIEQLPTGYRVRDLTIEPNVVLAPMAGVTDSVFRRMILGMGGCGLVFSEMTNAASVIPKAMKKHKLLDYLPEERPIALQITGHDPEPMVRAAKTVEQLGADILDINCGCPSPKVTGGGHGASLLRDLPKMAVILEAVRNAVDIPITLKYRSGWDDRSINYLETARIGQETGIDALILHPRTREQRYTGEANWEHIAEVKQHVSIPVIGSGDIREPMQAFERLHSAGVDGVMIGRAALSNPWIFQQIAQIRAGEEMFSPTLKDKHDLMLAYLDMSLESLPERLALNKLKQFIGHFSIGAPGSAVLRTSVQRSRTVAEARRWIHLFFTRNVERQRTIPVPPAPERSPPPNGPICPHEHS
jgi:nifR3 family TIM-barrel protein